MSFHLELFSFYNTKCYHFKLLYDKYKGSRKSISLSEYPTYATIFC